MAIAREDFLQDLIDEAQKQINLQHPIICDNVNLCELFPVKKLDQTLKKLKVSTLISMFDFFGVDICGQATLKALFMDAMYDLLRSCKCLITFKS